MRYIASVPQVVFLSLFLGLITGTQSVELQAGPAVASIRIDIGGRTAARIDQAPWSAKVDFGSALAPTELTAVAFDADGKEIARTSQFINLSRPPAEMELVIRSENGLPVEAELIGRHRLHIASREAKLSVDGTAVRVRRDLRATLPPLDSSRTHIISAELQFDDGEIARRDVVIQAGFSGSMDWQLTPMLVTTSTAKQVENLDGCFSAAGAPLRATSIEKSDAFVVIVKDPDMRRSMAGAIGLRLDDDAVERILWPISRPINARGEPTAIAFLQSVNHTKVQTAGWILTERLTPAPTLPEPRQFADAVAVAAMSTLEHGRRRAVILLLSNAPDRSIYTPRMVRRYLSEIGVPLFVWSAETNTADLAAVWGPIDNVSTFAGIQAAVARLNNTLARQRVVWLATDPLTALHAEGADRCGFTAVAHRNP